ncbi:MAG: hypothetical protein ACKO38_12170, partial [Planctomycetota bacterium]
GELAALRVEDRVGVRAMATGEFRPPYKGEWFLSGSYIEAYLAYRHHLYNSEGIPVSHPITH